MAIIAASLAWSVWQTNQTATVAYFSPLTRAWELAAGGLLAVSVPVLLRVPARVGVTLSIAGLLAIVAAGLLFDGDTLFPGYAVALPVAGAFLALAGGTVAPNYWVQGLLSIRPLQWIGKRSYAWYLWHWPLLAIVAARIGHPMTALQNLALCLIALGIGAASFALVEHPIHHSARLMTRTPWLSIALAAILVAASFETMSMLIVRR
jgi:peptidoglycan/LPS O-acetylase OafA/YrhL